MKKYQFINDSKNGLYELLSLFTVLVLVLVTIYLSVRDDYMTSESSLIELTQAIILLFSSALSFYQSRKSAQYSKVLYLLSLLLLVMLIREMDSPLEVYLSHGAWKYPAWCVILIGSIYLWKHFDTVVTQFQRFSEEKEYSILLIGILMILVFSRFAGMKEFWTVTLHIENSHNIKTLVEESLELLGYALILTSLVHRKTTN